MALVIRKKVSLDFLGEEYKDAYLVFKSIPLKDYQKILDEIPDATGGKEDNKKALNLIVNYLGEYFVSGKFPDDKGELQDVAAEDITDLDAETAITCFQTLMGQRIDPKSEAELKPQSSTTPTLPSN